MSKTGLVMEGGAMRGMFTAGVTDVFLENKIEFDGAVGVSAGACFGSNFKSRQSGRTIRYNMKYCRDKRYCSLRSLIKTGNLYGADFCYHEIPEKLDIFDNKAYKENPMGFYVVATDVESGKAVYKKCDKMEGNDLEWMRASASMPLVSKIVEIDGYKLLDGGMADSIPIKYFESIGYDRNVVILTQPKNFIKEKNKAILLIKLMLKKYPKLIEAMEKRHEIYNETTKYIFKKEEEGRLLVICPDEKLPIERMENNPDKLYEVYKAGRAVAEKRLDEIKKYLAG